ncbi:NnrS family protein [Pseudomonas putida]|nr:NnrS family protein [Pseudomonas putida]MDD2052166.1 NnrS family protein [Pseudomonas putida]
MLRSEGAVEAPFWSLGFRPFFLLGAAFSCLALCGWILWLAGLLTHWQPMGGMLAWHRHEMPFGFAVAIVAGFLLTAVPNWTGLPGLHGKPLMLLVALWLVARLAWLLPLPPLAMLVLQLLFLPALALILGRQLFLAGKRNNYPIIAVLGFMAICQAVTLSGILQDDVLLQRRGVLAGLWLIAALMTVIGGRVIPFFIQRGLSRTQGFAPSPWTDRVLLLGTVLIAGSIVAGFGDAPTVWLAPVYLLVAVLHAVRLVRWHVPGLWRVPLLWSLYLAYAWLWVAALGMVAWHLGFLAQESLATHALAVGGVGGMILAMISRVSLGHTGRALKPAWAMSLAFVAVNIAAVCRIAWVPFATSGLWVSGVLWALAFALFVVHYAAILLGPRFSEPPRP